MDGREPGQWSWIGGNGGGVLRPTLLFLTNFVACNVDNACCSCHEKVIHNFHILQYKIACGYNNYCHRVLKHVSEAQEILNVVHNNSKPVVHVVFLFTGNNSCPRLDLWHIACPALSKCSVAVGNIEGLVGSKHQVPLPVRGIIVKSNVG